MKFSNKLSVVILLTGVTILILLSVIIYKMNYNSTIAAQSLYTRSIAEEVSGDIDHFLREKVKIVQTLASAPILLEAVEGSNSDWGQLGARQRNESIRHSNEKWKSIKSAKDDLILSYTDNTVSRFLKTQQELLKGEYGEIFLTNKYGVLVASTAKLSTFAHGHKYWWKGAYNEGNGKAFFDDRGYDDSVGGYVLGVVVPVRNSREIIGILKCNLNILGNIALLVAGAQDKLLGRFKLTRSGGMVVYEEGAEPLSTQIHSSIFKRMNEKKTESFVLDETGTSHLVGIAEIHITKGGGTFGFGGTFESIDHKKGNTGESWFVVCCRKLDAVLSPVTESLRSIVIFGATIIGVLVVVSFVFGRRIAEPVSILDDATRILGKGQFEHRIELMRKDEFGRLAESFNHMAGALQDSTISIETLQKSEKKYRDMLESMIDSVYICSSDFRMEFMNDAMIKRIGRDATGEYCHKALYGLDEKCPWCLHSLVMQNEIAFQTVLSPTDDRSYHVTHTPINNLDGTISKLAIFRDITEREEAQREREKLLNELQDAMANIKTLKGLVPICSVCKKIRDDKGYWNQFEEFIEAHSDASFSHGTCPQCLEALYGDEEWFKKGKEKRNTKQS